MGGRWNKRLKDKQEVKRGDTLKKNQSEGGVFFPIKTSKIPDKVYKQIVSMISTGKLKPAEKLPSEREMASDLEVSRQSIREALYRAKTMGLIEVRQGEGSFVLSSVRETLKPPLTVLLEEEAERIFDFLEIRKLIEGWCAEKASGKATPENLEKMKEILKKMKGVVPTEKAWERVDREFHISVVAATQNVIAMHIMEALKDSFSSFFRLRRITTQSELKGLLCRQHNEIYRAISRRDPLLARQKAVEHLDFIEKRIKEDLKKMQE